ncbi:hypothetical protein KBX71_05255 [Micromonospora sp. D93]|uniref:hypothetical protein n=1 Tax=Micromonospora sp. D93 TaxID=2824886 RepID=UPI001B37C377|nr:hypothetical protein [Micromonospora sp. D93]MBQ1017273.1 hypothetical protein [Micromonospora sp. D93]
MFCDQRDDIRRRRSYRLHVLSWRAMFLSLATIASTQVLQAYHLISHGVSVGIVAPLAAVFVVSALTVIVTLGIQAAYLSANPLGRGIRERQIRFSRMLLVDLVSLPWSLRVPEK